MPKVSIITPCYNSEAYIGRTIESVRTQTFTNWEHIIVDDGSTDDGVAVIKAYAKTDPRLRLVHQQNGGVCNARNNGFKAASPDSEYLLFLDADDCLMPEMLNVLTTYLDIHPEVGLAYSNVVYVDDNDNILPTPPRTRRISSWFGAAQLPPDQVNTPLVSIICGAPVWPSFSVLRRSVYKQTPGWDEQLGQHHEDLDLALYVAIYSRLHYISQPLCLYRRHEGQSSSLQERHRSQSQKFDAKWKEEKLFPIQYKAQIDNAFRFRDRRLAPVLRFQAGLACLRQGNIPQAARHCLWAAMRYVGVPV